MSVSRVPGAPPRTDTPPTARSVSMHVTPVYASCISSEIVSDVLSGESDDYEDAQEYEETDGAIKYARNARICVVRMSYAYAMRQFYFGAATLEFNDAFVTAVIAVNALGDVYDHKSGKLPSRRELRPRAYSREFYPT